MLAKTYQTVTPPEPEMPWETYANIIREQFAALLQRTDTSERDFQLFFEDHPSYLPEVHGLFGCGGHGPYPGAVVSQPILPGFNRKIPDFLYIARDSATVYAVLIEIEHPTKPWATMAGQSSAEFTQATNQLLEWKTWFRDPLNAAQFLKLYRIPDDWIRYRTFEQRYVLIYGRRSDKTLTPDFNKKRHLLQRGDETYMTFDRLHPDRMLSQCLSTKLDEDGYHAISVPPTFTVGAMMNYGTETILGKEAAVQANKYLSNTRKDFLVSRIPNWDEINKKGNIWRSLADRE